MDSRSDILIALHIAATQGQLDSSIFERLPEDPSSISECEVLDFKSQLPDSEFEYSKTVRDLIALHNSYGGFVVFGVGEIEKDRTFSLIGVERDKLKVNKLRDTMLACSGEDIRIQPFSTTVAGFHLETIWVAKRSLGDRPVRFVRNGPEEKPGKLIFKKGDVVFRRIESNAVAHAAEDYDFLYSDRRPPSLELPAFDAQRVEPLDNNLPDRAVVCSNFVGRTEDIGDLWTWLSDDFSRVRLIAGEGGLGKTSLAYQFSEELASRRVKPYSRVVWLTAKERQFIASKDDYREAAHIDFSDADSLFRAIGAALGCIDADFDGLDTKDLMKLALEACAVVPSFLVVDDVDSLSQPDQLRALEFGMRTPAGTKLLLTTRVNFSYSPDNVLKLNGLPLADFKDYIFVLRERYDLPKISDGKIAHIRDVTGGSPLFADSLIRLERRGASLDQALVRWKGERGLEARKAALMREVQQLSKEAKRILFVISTLRNCSYVELSQVVGYTDQTLGDALQELSGLFLISAPSIAKEARYTVEPNTGLLVLELASTLGIDHAALVAATKRSRSDAIGLGLQKRSSIVGLTISEAIARLTAGDSKGALDVIVAAAKKLSKPHPDLLLAAGRFNLHLTQPNYEEARKNFEEAYRLGQRKPLLFELWFESELGRGSFDGARDVAGIAIEQKLDGPRWLERSAQAHVALAQRGRSRFSNDAAIREVELAIGKLREAKKMSVGEMQRRRFEQLVTQAVDLRKTLSAR